MCGSKGPVGTSNILESALPFDLSIFKSLQQIEVSGCTFQSNTLLPHFSHLIHPISEHFLSVFSLGVASRTFFTNWNWEVEKKSVFCVVRFKGTTPCLQSGWSWKSSYSARLFSHDWWMYSGECFIFTSYLRSHLLLSLLLSSAQWMQLPADSGFVISPAQSGYSEHLPLNRDDDGIVRLLRRISLRVSYLLHWEVRCVLTVPSPSWSRRQASCRSGNLRGSSLTVLLQFSSLCGKTWQRWIWVTTASRPLTDLWWVTPIRLFFFFSF